MQVVVACRTCSTNVSSAEISKEKLIAAVLFMCHCTTLHTPQHDLALLIDGNEVGHEGKVEARFRCLNTSCSACPPTVFHVRPEWVAAVALVHHAAHEGHQMEMTLDGEVFRLP